MSTVRNHDWWDPATLRSLGTIDAERVSELSEGRLRHDVGVRLNRAVVEHDLTLIIGPVFPHEVVAFSGGNKPLFPGVAAQDIIDLSHWLGALITSVDLIGTVGTTPVRALIDEAADMVPSPWWRSAWWSLPAATHCTASRTDRRGRRRSRLRPISATSTTP